ncbi:hypothetical protein V1522DRAFT_113932 [Lipomyces starkeyi]
MGGSKFSDVSKRFALILVTVLSFIMSVTCANNTTNQWIMSESEQMAAFIDCLELSGNVYKYSLTEPQILYFCQANGDGPSQVSQSNMTWVSYCMSHVGVRFSTIFVTCDEEELSIATYVPRRDLTAWANRVGYPVRAAYRTMSSSNYTIANRLQKRTGYYHVFVDVDKACKNNDMHVAETDKCSTHASKWASIDVLATSTFYPLEAWIYPHHDCTKDSRYLNI